MYSTLRWEKWMEKTEEVWLEREAFWMEYYGY